MIAMGPNSVMQGFVVSGAMPAKLTQKELNIEVKRRLVTKKLKIEVPEDDSKSKKGKKKKDKKSQESENEEAKESIATEECKTPELTNAQKNAEFVHQMLINLAIEPEKNSRVLFQLNPSEPGGDFIKLTAQNLYRRVLKMKSELDKFDINVGDRVVICLRSVNLITAIYTCLMKGAIPIPCRPPVDNCALTSTLITKESKVKKKAFQHLLTAFLFRQSMF